jgi:dolichyl-phosphate-mannose-protein mannosyltransferase
VIYYVTFVVHFAVLNQLGDANSFMSGRFQYSIVGDKYHNGTAELVNSNSKIEIRHLATAGGYLHSHRHHYPSGSKQQQITLYPFQNDNNNIWHIYKKQSNATSSDIIEHGNIVHLKHEATGAFLHSHNIRAPLSNGDHYNEARYKTFILYTTYHITLTKTVIFYSGYIYEDMNNDWKVEIVDFDHSDPLSRTTLKAIKSKFRLRHVVTGCYLISKKLRLPKWGFNQKEVGHFTITTDLSGRELTYIHPGCVSEISQAKKRYMVYRNICTKAK